MKSLLYLQTRIRCNYVLRTILLPLIRLKRRINLYEYQNSDAPQYIKELKDSCYGERCFIIGNGPSLTSEDLDLLKNEKTFAFNRIYHMYQYTGWRPTYYMVVDKAIIHEMNREKEREIEAECFFVPNKKLVQKYKDQNAHHIGVEVTVPARTENMVLKKVSTDVSKQFSTAAGVITSAFELAFYMGFKEIYLLGVDHNFAVEIDKNGHKTVNKNCKYHFKEDKEQSPFVTYKDTLTHNFEVCGNYAVQHGIKIVNVTRGGKLEVFERDTLEHVIGKRGV